MRNLITLILNERSLNYKIVEAQDGIDLLKKIKDDQKKNNKIKCVFTDEKMDYMDGSTSVAIIRDMEKRNKIKKVNVVSVTSFEDESNKDFIMKSGIDFIIKKPCSKMMVTNILEKFNLLS